MMLGGANTLARQKRLMVLSAFTGDLPTPGSNGCLLGLLQAGSLPLGPLWEAPKVLWRGGHDIPNVTP